MKDELRSAEAERRGDVRARARGPKRATYDNGPRYRAERPLILRGAERKVAEPGARPAATTLSSLSYRAGRVPGATSAGRPASGDHRRQRSARLLAGQQCAAMAGELSCGRGSSAMAAPSVRRGARRGAGAGRACPIGGAHARRVPDPRPRARAGGLQAGRRWRTTCLVAGGASGVTPPLRSACRRG